MTSKRYHIILASILFAILMWVSVNLGYEYQVTRQIPLIFEGLPEGTAFMYPVPTSLTVKLRGPGWQHLTALVTGQLVCIISLDGGNNRSRLLTDKDLRELIKLPTGLTAISFQPDTLLIDFDAYAQKRVPVILDLDMELREGFGIVGKPTIQPESVLIGGAARVLERIAEWHTERRKLTNLMEPVSSELNLRDPATRSLSLPQRSVHLTIDVQPFAEKVFRGLSVEALSVPPNREIVLIPPRIDITARGAIGILASVAKTDFQIFVNYESLVAETTGVIQPELRAPEGVNIIGRNPERVQFVIRKRL